MTSKRKITYEEALLQTQNAKRQNREKQQSKDPVLRRFSPSYNLTARYPDPLSRSARLKCTYPWCHCPIAWNGELPVPDTVCPKI